MELHICDFCSAPIKGEDYYQLYVRHISEHYNDEDNVNSFSYLNTEAKKVKEICPTCKGIFDRIFELRMEKIEELAAELQRMYELAPKKIEDKRKPKTRKPKK